MKDTIEPPPPDDYVRCVICHLLARSASYPDWAKGSVCHVCRGKLESPYQSKDPFSLDPIIEEFAAKVRRSSYDNAVAFKLFVSFQEYQVEWVCPNGDQLKADGISMRNLKGEPVR
jgi:hypothetical protein